MAIEHEHGTSVWSDLKEVPSWVWLGAAVGAIIIVLIRRSSSSGTPTATPGAQAQPGTPISGTLPSGTLSAIESLGQTDQAILNWLRNGSGGASSPTTPTGTTTPAPSPGTPAPVSGGQPPSSPLTIPTSPQGSMPGGMFANPWNILSPYGGPGATEQLGPFNVSVPQGYYLTGKTIQMPQYNSNIPSQWQSYFSQGYQQQTAPFQQYANGSGTIIAALPYAGGADQPIYVLQNGNWQQLSTNASLNLANFFNSAPGQTYGIGYTGAGQYSQLPGQPVLPALPNGGVSANSPGGTWTGPPLQGAP